MVSSQAVSSELSISNSSEGTQQRQVRAFTPLCHCSPGHSSAWLGPCPLLHVAIGSLPRTHFYVYVNVSVGEPAA